MREKRRMGNYHCQTILHMLKFLYVLESNVVIKGIAIINSTSKKCSCNSFGDSKTYIGKYDDGHGCDKSNNDNFVKYVLNF